jgi:hypothetical protein
MVTTPNGGDATPPIPTWVKVLAIIGILVTLVMLGLMIFGGDHHGPRRHMSAADTSAAVL